MRHVSSAAFGLVLLPVQVIVAWRLRSPHRAESLGSETKWREVEPRSVAEELFGIHHWKAVAGHVRDVHHAAEVDPSFEALSVKRYYEIAWLVVFSTLAILTFVYALLEGVPWRTEKGLDRFRHTAKGISTGEGTEYHIVHMGYTRTAFGGTLWNLWNILPAIGYAQMIMFTIDHYLIALHVPDQSWLQLAEPFLVVFAFSHIVLFYQSYFRANAKVFFMTPTPLCDASNVLITSPETKDLGTLVDVKLVDTSSGPCRCFEYTCVHYLWDDHNESFEPTGHDDVTCASAKQRLASGGLSKADVQERQSAGPNRIEIVVPGMLASLANEFLSAIYIFQFSCIWVYMFYSTWNIASIWLVLAMISGSTKAFLTRRNQLQIQAMAANETEATVLREGDWRCVSSAAIVPGDIIRVQNGLVPCDVAILEGCAVVNESMLTGEPMPVQRFAIGDERPDATVEASSDMKRHFIFAGTHVMQSSGKATEQADGKSQSGSIGLAVATGARTAKGSLVRMVLFPFPIRFKFTDQLPYVYCIMCTYVVVLFLVQFAKDQGHWIVSMFSGLCLLTQSLQPNMPVSFTLAQNISAHRLKSSLGILCLSPERTPLAGKVHVMVLDKTGTITKDGMDFAGAHACDANSFLPFCESKEDGASHWAEQLPLQMQWAVAACHTVTKLADGGLVGNAVEVAMLKSSGWWLSEDGRSMIQNNTVNRKIEILRRLEFDHHRMTSGVVIRVPSDGVVLALIKGSYEKVEKLTSAKTPVPQDFKDVTERHASDQYYVLGVGVRELSDFHDEMTRDDFEKDLRLLGLLLFRNEVKPDSPQALAELRAGGVRCVMCTGDNALTGAAVGRRCGMLGVNDSAAFLGDISGDGGGEGDIQWTALGDGARVDPETVFGADAEDVDLVLSRPAFKQLHKHGKMEEILDKVRVYARMRPEDKVAVIELHQARGLVVGMAGDGGNDCGALRAAHVGLALSDAEASMVAPFSSGADYGTGFKSLRALPDLLRFGRATLSTNLATFMYFMVYAFALPFAKLTILFMGNMMIPEWDWLVIDIAIGSGMVAIMTLSWPSKRLAEIRPTSQLLGSRTIVLVFTQVLLFIGFVCLALWLVRQQAFYSPYDSLELGVPGHEWQKKGDNYDCEIAFLFLALQLATSAFVLSFGAEYRRNVLYNVPLTITYILALAFFAALVWGGPSDFTCMFRVNCDSYTSQRMYVAGVQELSTGNLGGCFLGPQLLQYKQKLGDDFSIPDVDANDCRPHPSVNLEEEIRVPSGALPWLGAAMCKGPNNCLDRSFREILSGLLVCMVICSITFTKLISMYHPAPRKHFKKL